MIQQTQKLATTPEPSVASSGNQVCVSFVIPAYNEQKLIAGCLKSIKSLLVPDVVSSIETIVVDNQSTDLTVEISEDFGARIVSCLPGHPSRARNAGANASRGDWLIFIDADCRLASDWLVLSAETMLDSGVIATGGSIVPPVNENNWVVKTLGELADPGIKHSPVKARWLATGALLVTKDAFEAINGFDETLISCEDCDLGYRLAEHGQLICNPKMVATHYGESKSLNELFWRECWRSQGNLQLASTRLGDLKNWGSLAVPVLFVFLIMLGTTGWIVACSFEKTIWPWLTMFVAGSFMPVMVLFRQRRRTLDLLSFVRQLSVTSTFLAGRAVGLFMPCPRVER